MLSRTRPDPSNSTLITAVTAWRVSQVHLRSSATTFSPKGDKLYYIARATEGGANLFEQKPPRRQHQAAHQGGCRGGIVTDAKGENVFVITGSGMKKVDLAKGDVKDIEFEAPYDRRPSLEREYIYEHMLRQVADKFYDENLHGVDWKYYGDHYREFLPISPTTMTSRFC